MDSKKDKQTDSDGSDSESEWFYGNAKQLRQVMSIEKKDNSKDLTYNLGFLLGDKVLNVLRVLIDTGAHVNCVGHKYLVKVMGTKNIKLNEVREITHDYSRNVINVMEEIVIRCRLDRSITTLCFKSLRQTIPSLYLKIHLLK